MPNNFPRDSPWRKIKVTPGPRLTGVGRTKRLGLFDEESEYRGSVGEVERQKEKNREREREFENDVRTTIGSR